MAPQQPDRRGQARRQSDIECDECFQERGGWHLDKKVSLTHLITTLAIFSAGIGYVIQNEKNHAVSSARIDAIFAVISELKEANFRQDKAMDESVARIELLIRRSEDKIDRLLEGKKRG